MNNVPVVNPLVGILAVTIWPFILMGISIVMAVAIITGVRSKID